MSLDLTIYFEKTTMYMNNHHIGEMNTAYVYVCVL